MAEAWPSTPDEVVAPEATTRGRPLHLGRALSLRLAQILLVVWAAATVAFFLGHIVGDPVNLLLPPELAQSSIKEQFIKEKGLDRPVLVQYGDFLLDASSFDFGDSWQFKRSARDLVLERVPATMKLALTALVLAVVSGLSSGIIAAYWRGGRVDATVSAVVLLGQIVPTFVVGILLLKVVAVDLGWFPVGGDDGMKSLVLPAFTLSVGIAAPIAKLTRSSMASVLGQDFIRMLRLEGLPERTIVLKHGLRNASLPIATIVALQLSLVITGAVITESVFRWPGVGSLVVGAVLKRDFAIVQAAVVLAVIAIAVLNLLLDLLYVVLDPRVSYGSLGS